MDEEKAAPSLLPSPELVTNTYDEDTSLIHESKKVKWHRLIGINSFNLAYALVTTTLGFQVLPSEIARLFPANSSEVLGVVSGLGAITHVLAPIVGVLSDNSTSKYGKRRPWLFFGSIFLTLGSIGMWFGSVLLDKIWYILGYNICLIGCYITYASFCALMPDFVPKDQLGEGAAWQAVVYAIGSLIGLSIPLYAPISALYWVYIAVTWLCVWWTWVVCREQPLDHINRPALSLRDFTQAFCFDPKENRDFFLCYIQRVLFFMGLSIQNFELYFLRDIIDVPDANQAFSICAIVVLVTAMIASYPTGALSDRLGCKTFVYVSSACIMLSHVFFILCKSLWAVALVSVLYGVGQGINLSVAWALGVKTIPDESQYGKYLGLWSISSLIGSLIGPLVDGPLLQRVGGTAEPNHYALKGYTSIFALDGGFVLLGVFFIMLIRKVK